MRRLTLGALLAALAGCGGGGSGGGNGNGGAVGAPDAVALDYANNLYGITLDVPSSFAGGGSGLLLTNYALALEVDAASCVDASGANPDDGENHVYCVGAHLDGGEASGFEVDLPRDLGNFAPRLDPFATLTGGTAAPRDVTVKPGGGLIASTGSELLSSSGWASGASPSWSLASSTEGAWTVDCSDDACVASDPFSGEHLLSQTGDAWVTGSAGLPFAAVAYGEGRFVAADSFNLEIVHSNDDGVNWTIATMPGVDHKVDAIAYGGGEFLAVRFNGSTFATYASEDGATFTQVTVEEDVALQGVTYSPTAGTWIGFAGSRLFLRPPGGNFSEAEAGISTAVTFEQIVGL